MKGNNRVGYNERLFSSGFRRWLHFARFFWLRKKLSELNELFLQSVIELGCFDGKTIDFLPSKPNRYLGLDANWEDGLASARQKWKDQPNYEFSMCTKPDEMREGELFDIAIAMETLEHIPEQFLQPYLKKLEEVTKHYIFITVPNEKGIVFFFKYIAKRLFFGGSHEHYSLHEFISALLGQMHEVKRNEHKGFDYATLVREVSQHFEIVEVSGIPFTMFPPILNFQVGIVGRKSKGNKK